MENWDFKIPPESDLKDREVARLSDRLQQKRIALLITGSIAAIKAPLIARSLRRQGAEVVAFVSSSALRYTTIDALEWSTVNPVITKLTASAEHLSEDRPFAAYLVAPATYNTINKLNYGIADGVISSTLASALGKMERGKTKILLAPTMHGSLHNSILTDSLKNLQAKGIIIIPPRVGDGKNYLPSEKIIVNYVCRNLTQSSLKDIPILVTAGPTPIAIDNIRRLTNRFTGKLGCSIAEELYLRGAKVKLIHGIGSYNPPDYLPHRIIHSYDEYTNAVIEELKTNKSQYAIFSAAVADYKCDRVFDGKIPSGGSLQSLNLSPTAKVIELVRKEFPDLHMVTFKYQENVSHSQLMKIARSRLDRGYQMVVANRGDEKGNNGEQIAYLVTKEANEIKVMGKQAISIAIVDYLAKSQIDISIARLS